MLTVQTWSCDIFQFDGPIWKPETSLRPLESRDHFYDMQRMNDACNAMMIFRVCGWSFKSFSLIKSWVQNWAFLMIPNIRNLCLMLSVFLLPLPIVWLKVIWWIFVPLSLDWLTNAPMEWPTICRKNFSLALCMVGKLLLCSGRRGFVDA